jgi:hypothetical protein
MIISFKDRFVDKIKNGTKKHTIRGDKHDRWKGGTRMDMATGVRTTAYRKFAEKTCTGTQKISIKYFDEINSCMIWIDGIYFGSAFFDQEKLLFTPEIKQLAENDGFDDIRKFLNWFGKDFEGKIIHWTDLRY